MIKLSDNKWNIEEVKKQTYKYFKKNIELLISVGNIQECSETEIRNTYEDLTGRKVETNKHN
jgi:hypothetical protein